MKKIKDFLKKYLLVFKIKDRFSPSVQIGQRQLFHFYQSLAHNNNLPGLNDTGFRVFSQFEEDGKLLYIFSIIGMDNKIFIEVGSDDGLNSNCANLAFNFGWYGIFIDGNSAAIERGKQFYRRYPNPWMYQPAFVCAKIKIENINEIIAAQGYKGEIALLSIDIDGNDYWIWNALDIVIPKVVIIETHVEFGYENIVVPYNPDYYYPGEHPLYHGASPVAMVNLARKKGYRLVGANELGFNFIFIKNGIADELIPEVAVESVLRHPAAIQSFSQFELVKDRAYIKG